MTDRTDEARWSNVAALPPPYIAVAAAIYGGGNAVVTATVQLRRPFDCLSQVADVTVT